MMYVFWFRPPSLDACLLGALMLTLPASGYSREGSGGTPHPTLMAYP